MALSAVVLPAPLGPMSPRMRPFSTLRLTSFSATVVPNLLRRPRASMHVMASALLLLLLRIRLIGVRRFGIGGRLAGRAIQKLFRVEAEPLNDGVNAGPLFAKKLLPFALQQHVASARIDEHAQAAPGFNQTLIH